VCPGHSSPDCRPVPRGPPPQLHIRPGVHALLSVSISVIQIAELVLDHGEDPATVADQLDISLAEVHEALAYYYDHPDAMHEQRRRRDELTEELAASSEAPETVER
jgi:hypothetical protein